MGCCCYPSSWLQQHCSLPSHMDRQPSHVHLCLRSSCVSAHWPSGAVTSTLHNSSQPDVWRLTADTREAARGDPVFPGKEHAYSTWGRVEKKPL